MIEGNNLAGAKTALATYAATPEGAKDLAPKLPAAEIERREGNLEASAQRFQALIASNRADSDALKGALRGLSDIRLAPNRPTEALAIFDQLIARNPQDLRSQLARTSLAYQAKLINELQAQAVLNSWLQTQPSTKVPPELFTPVCALPAEVRREPLYEVLAQIDPNNVSVQLRLLQVIAKCNPAKAKARVAQLVARVSNNIGNYFLQGQLAQGIGELDLASQLQKGVLNGDLSRQTQQIQQGFLQRRGFQPYWERF
jgi:tetratricopeptide (TPR) repeat protein